MPKFSIKAGAQSVDIPVEVFDSSSTTGAMLGSLAFGTSGLVAYYSRQGAAGAAVQINLLTKTKGTWTTSGFVAVDNTNMVGTYELGVPDAALLAGARWVTIDLHGAANMVPVKIEIELTGWDNQVATIAANLTQILGTTLTESVGGYIAAAFKKLYDVLNPTMTCLSLSGAIPGASGGVPTTNGTKLNQTVDLTSGQSITASNMRGTDNAALASTALSNATWTDARAGYLDALNSLRPKKNVALPNFTFPMFDANGALLTGLTVTVSLIKDAGAAAASTNAAAEVGTTGRYRISLTQAEMNADSIEFSASAPTAVPTDCLILTQV